MTINPTIDIRAAAPHEAAAIGDIVRAAYARWIPVIGREPRPMQTDYQTALRDHQFDVAVENGQILGLIETMQYDDHIWIENVAVVPQAQGRGIGRRLLAYVERRAIDAGCCEARLLTNAAFEANVSLYRGLGYAIDRQEDFMNGTTVYMSRKLA